MERVIPEEARSGPPVERAVLAGQLIEQLATATSELSRLRREAIEELIDDGHTKTQIARMIGLDPSRVTRIVGKGTPPERALLSPDGGPVTIALGSKMASFGDGHPSDMISRDAAEAYDILRRTLEEYGVTCAREVVAAPGLIDLNRDRLIVLGSPKILPVVGQVLASDPNIAFDADSSGRYLVDRNTNSLYRSPQDAGTPEDYGYIGRLPRPDGKGTFLYAAGIHAPGTHGAARYIVDHLSELYRTVRNKTFSMVIRAAYDPNSRERIITSTSEMTQVYVR